MAEAIVEILENDSLFYSLRRRAYDYGRSRTWPEIGRSYWKLFSARRLPIRITTKAPLSAAETVSSIEVPEPSLAHLKKLTDDTGLVQHAKFTVPNRYFGYCTDDNARGVILMTRYYAQYPELEALELFDSYLSFILHAQNNDGTIRNLMNFDRTWQINEPVNDGLGRFLWALGTVMAEPPSASYLSIIKDCFDRSVKYVEKQHPRGMGYSILGMSDYLRQFPGASDIKRQLEIAAEGLMRQYEVNHLPDWSWFEDILTYDNGVLPQALFIAGQILGNKKYIKVAKDTCEFLLANTFNGEYFSFVGCRGWYERGGKRATFDQLPVEAASMVMMLRSAYDATEEERFLRLQRKAFDWFLGQNDLHTPLYDFKTTGCYDGLMAGGVNLNQGAESTLSFLLSLLAIVESYALIDKIERGKGVTARQAKLIEKTIKKPEGTKIVSVKGKSKSKKSQVTEPA
jgi:hypothetical protein